MATPKLFSAIILDGHLKSNGRLERVFLPIKENNFGNENQSTNMCVCGNPQLSSKSFGVESQYFLRLKNLPHFLREAVFEGQKYDLENYAAFCEAVLTLASERTRVLENTNTTLEFIYLIKTIKAACIPLSKMLFALRLS